AYFLCFSEKTKNIFHKTAEKYELLFTCCCGTGRSARCAFWAHSLGPILVMCGELFAGEFAAATVQLFVVAA
ncbi:MAG TPA: hypothetical protein PLY97_01820, partial [Acidocella sp.]|nr:hypothetical protein [Acidocella sp.]